MLYENLPILDILEELKKTLASNTTLILQAPPGAGKSTLLPLKLLQEPWLAGKKIILLEPRRLAAKTVATRLSEILEEEVGNTVGYRVRFDTKISSNTKIEVVTEGILTRMLQQDNSLEGIGLVIFDEFHERSLASDLALALTREIQKVIREDLRILIMSATLDGEKLSILLGKSPIITSKGRQYPIEINYAVPDNSLAFPIQITRAIKKAYNHHPNGDILVFLPGMGEIHKVKEQTEEIIQDAIILPLYGDLSIQKQQQAIQPNKDGKRKIILATSIAETSLTIEGVKIVIDSGLSRAPKFDPKTGLTRLETIKVTKDAADQRAGRAGRLGPGVCYRLWSEGAHLHLTPNRSPEIEEADLAPMLLELYGWGEKNIYSMEWLTPPPAEAIAQAKQLLEELEAISLDKITDKGKGMLRLPTHPRLAHLLLEGEKSNLLSLATDIAALLEEKDPLDRGESSNIFLRVNALRQWRQKSFTHGDKNTLERVERLANSWRSTFKITQNNASIAEENIGKLIAVAFPERIAKRRDKDHNYRLANGRIAKLQENDSLITSEWLAIAHLDSGNSIGKIYLAAPLFIEDVEHLAKEVSNISWDKNKGIIIAKNELKIGDAILKSTPINNVPDELKNKLLCTALREEGLQLLNWSEKSIEFQARIASAKIWRPEENWPDITNNALRNSIEEWLSPYLIQVKKREDFSKLNMEEILFSLIPWNLQSMIEQIVPEKLKVPSGSFIKLTYKEDGSSPVLAARLQELFGLLETPTINEGKIKILLHLLSPGYRPVQVTQDLKSFWKNTYPEVRKELRIRYQKHSWPEDPWTAEAIRGIKRKDSNSK